MALKFSIIYNHNSPFIKQFGARNSIRKPPQITQTAHKSRKPLDESPRFGANRSVLSLWTYKPVKMQRYFTLLVEYRSKPLKKLVGRAVVEKSWGWIDYETLVCAASVYVTDKIFQ